MTKSKGKLYLCGMNIKDAFSILFQRKQYAVLRRDDLLNTFDAYTERHKFGEMLYLNIIELQSDIYNEVIWSPKLGFDGPLYKGWQRFMQYSGLRILVQLKYGYKGYVVVAWRRDGSDYVFWQLGDDDYIEMTKKNAVVIKPKDPNVSFYVIKSPTFDTTGHSDRFYCNAYIKYLDNILNGSNTVSQRLGTFVIGSPATPNGAPAMAVLNEYQKKELEESLQKEYGALSHQKQIMILPNGMNFQTINLAGLDQKTTEKAKLAILAICDRVKVPANQVAIIDASSSRSLANGTELREGDLAKYRSFRRYLNATLYDFAVEIGLKVDYTIENEPLTTQGDTIEN